MPPQAYRDTERALRELRADLRVQWADVPTSAYDQQALSYPNVVVDSTVDDPTVVRYRRLVSGAAPKTATKEWRPPDIRALGTLRASNVVFTDTGTLAIEDVYKGFGPWGRYQSRLRPLRTADDVPTLAAVSPQVGEPDEEHLTPERRVLRRLAHIRVAATTARGHFAVAPPDPGVYIDGLTNHLRENGTHQTVRATAAHRPRLR